MLISIIIPAFNEELLIGGTLKAVRASCGAFEQRGWRTEIIVCDNNSKDRTAEIARAAGARVVFEPVNQIGRARNCGAAAAEGEWLIFVDADSKPGLPLFGSVAEAVGTGRIIGGGSTLRLDTNKYTIARLVTFLWNWFSRMTKWVAGSFIFVEAAAFKEIGGFSLRYFAAEELEFSKRLKALARGRGKKVVMLHNHPLITSARKMHLYKPWEHLRFLLRASLFPGRTLSNRDACGNWYDGRR